MTFITAGYPTVQDTVPVLLSMQEGGADIIELGVPFSDPIADGKAIQKTNLVRLRLSSPWGPERVWGEGGDERTRPPPRRPSSLYIFRVSFHLSSLELSCYISLLGGVSCGGRLNLLSPGCSAEQCGLRAMSWDGAGSS